MCEGGGLLTITNNNLFRAGTPSDLVGRKLQSPLKRSRSSDSSGITDEELRSIESPKLKKQKSIENKLDSPRSVIKSANQSQEIKAHSPFLISATIPLKQENNIKKEKIHHSPFFQTDKSQTNDSALGELNFEDCFEYKETINKGKLSSQIKSTSNLDGSFSEEDLNDSVKKPKNKKNAPNDFLLDLVLKENNQYLMASNQLNQNKDTRFEKKSPSIYENVSKSNESTTKTPNHINNDIETITNQVNELNISKKSTFSQLQFNPPELNSKSPSKKSQLSIEIENQNTKIKSKLKGFPTLFFKSEPRDCEKQLTEINDLISNGAIKKEFIETMKDYAATNFEKILNISHNNSDKTTTPGQKENQTKKFEELKGQCEILDTIITERENLFNSISFKKSFEHIFKERNKSWYNDIYSLALKINKIGQIIDAYKPFLNLILMQINIMIEKEDISKNHIQINILKLKKLFNELFKDPKISNSFKLNILQFMKTELYSKEIEKTIDSIRTAILNTQLNSPSLKESIQCFKKLCATKHQKKYEDLIDQFQSNYEKKLFRHLQKKQHTFYTIINGKNKVSMIGRQLISNVLFQFRKEFDELINDENSLSENQFMYHEDLFETYQCKSYELKSFLEVLRSKSINPANEMTSSSSEKNLPLLFIEKTTQTICKDIIDLLAKMDISAPETINKLGINPHTLTFNALNHTTIYGELGSILTEETIKKCSSFQKDILTLYFKISEFENQCECFIKNESKELVNRIKFIKSLLTSLMETNSKEVVRKKRNLLKFIPLHLTKK